MSSTREHNKQLKEWRVLLRVLRDPYWFATDVLGYDRLTREFHEPMMKVMWTRFLRRPLVVAAVHEQVESKILHQDFKTLVDRLVKKEGLYYKNTGDCWSRDHYKTTVKIAECAMHILLWPEITIAHWHAVEGNAIECSLELGEHFFSNKELRAIRPQIMPSKATKRFNTASGFTVKRRDIIGGVYQSRERHPTFAPKGAGAEVTGRHAIHGWLDDIVGQSTIDDSAMPRVRTWLGHTVAHVIRTDGGWLEATYTPWDEDDVMCDWEKDKSLWDCRVRACMETDGVRDWHGTPVLYDKRWIKRKQNDPQCNFPYQMMCDRVPDSERRWPSDWNGFCKRDWALQGNGRIFVLSDPAPMGLSLRGEKDRVRGDTGKDWWAISVVRLRVRGDFQDRILLDGSASQEWTAGQGYDELCRLMQKWSTNMAFDEDYSGGQGFDDFIRACTRNGVRPRTEYDGKGRRMWPKYLESYQKHAKNKRFQKLCDAAESGSVWIADSCPEEFWRGDGDKVGALTQAKKWIPRKGGESTLKWDDHFDSWARSTDRKLQEYAPSPDSPGLHDNDPGSIPGDPFNMNGGSDSHIIRRSRYGGV